MRARRPSHRKALIEGRGVVILRLHHAEIWRVSTIAPQLGVDHSTARRVGDPDEMLRCPP